MHLLADLFWSQVATTFNVFSFDFNSWPCPGMSCFIMAVEEESVIAVAPATTLMKSVNNSALVSLTQSLKEAGDASIEVLTNLGEDIKVISLVPGQAAWVPAGNVPLASTRSLQRGVDATEGVVLVVPIVDDATTFMHTAGHDKHVVSYIKRYYDHLYGRGHQGENLG